MSSPSSSIRPFFIPSSSGVHEAESGEQPPVVQQQQQLQQLQQHQRQLQKLEQRHRQLLLRQLQQRQQHQQQLQELQHQLQQLQPQQPPPPPPYCSRLKAENAQEMLKNPPRFYIHFIFGGALFVLTEKFTKLPYVALGVAVLYLVYCAIPLIGAFLWPGEQSRLELFKAHFIPYYKANAAGAGANAAGGGANAAGANAAGGGA